MRIPSSEFYGIIKRACESMMKYIVMYLPVWYIFEYSYYIKCYMTRI